MSSSWRADAGFTLIEVVVAIVLLTIGVLALAAGAAATVRSMADADRIGVASHTAEGERERAFASTCAAAAGTDSVNGAHVTWSASPTGSFLSITQAITLPRATIIDVASAGACR